MNRTTSYEPMVRQTGVSKLADDNYFKWSYEVEMYLRMKELWNNCLTTPDEYLQKISEEEAAEDITKLKNAFISDDSKCLAIIGLHVTEKYYGYIKKATCAKEAWENLKAEFGANNLYYILNLKFQFYSCSMAEVAFLIYP